MIHLRRLHRTYSHFRIPLTSHFRLNRFRTSTPLRSNASRIKPRQAFPYRYIPLTLAAGGALYYGYQYSLPQNWKEQRTKLELIPLPMEEPEPFVHPYDDEPWYRQFLYRTARVLYLSFIFTPCTLVGIAAALTKSSTLREYWLDLLVSTIEKAGCTFQKFGQWLSMRPDMFPKDVIDALSKLRCEAPSHDMSHTRKEITSSFGKELEEIFEFFDSEPVASGTCAQVHQARLRPEYALDNGCQDVAVKVRHPNVIWETFADLELVFQFVENSVNLIHMSFPFGQEDFKVMMQQQIDFKWEAYNLLKFDKLFGDEELIKFPKVSLDFLSPSVLMESWMPGEPVAKFLESFGEMYKDQAEAFEAKFDIKIKEKKQKMARIIHDMSMKMFLRDNFMHGDLHGGNVLLSEDGSLTVIDTGITTSISPDWQPKFGQFLKYIVIGDNAGLTDTLLAFHEGDASDDNKQSFREAMKATTAKFVGSPGKAPDGGMVDMGDFVGEIMFNLSENHVHLRSDIAASIQSMSISEGLIRMLDPEYDVCKGAIPYFLKYGV